jgi:hypothetical protein
MTVERTERIVAKNIAKWTALGWSQSKISSMESMVRKICGSKRPDAAERQNKKVRDGTFNLYKNGNRFKKGEVPWNKGKKTGPAWNKGLKTPEEVCKKLSIRTKEMFKNGSVVQWAKGKTKETDKRIWNTTQSESRNKKISDALKEKYKDEDYKKMAVERSFRSVYDFRFPNKSEEKILKLLNSKFKDDWIYVGDWKLIIDGKNPDFIHMRDKKVIEFFGDYWHKPEDEEWRINHFRKNRYDTLVIWERELKDVNKIYEKIKNYYYT